MTNSDIMTELMNKAEADTVQHIVNAAKLLDCDEESGAIALQIAVTAIKSLGIFMSADPEAPKQSKQQFEVRALALTTQALTESQQFSVLAESLASPIRMQ